MILYGAGGHAKVIADILQATHTKIVGVLDDNSQITRFLDFPFLGKYTPAILSGQPIIIAIGNNKTRKEIAETIHGPFKSAIHPSAVISKSAKIGEGTCVMPCAVINTETRIGEHCIINTAAVIEHDCYLDNFVHVAPNATIAGEVSISEGAFIGAGAVVIPKIRIGKWAVIGAGATIIENIPDYAVVVGCPGKIIKFSQQR